MLFKRMTLGEDSTPLQGQLCFAGNVKHRQRRCLFANIDTEAETNEYTLRYVFCRLTATNFFSVCFSHSDCESFTFFRPESSSLSPIIIQRTFTYPFCIQRKKGNGMRRAIPFIHSSSFLSSLNVISLRSPPRIRSGPKTASHTAVEEASRTEIWVSLDLKLRPPHRRV